MPKNLNYTEIIIFKFSRFFLMMKEDDHDGKRDEIAHSIESNP